MLREEIIKWYRYIAIEEIGGVKKQELKLHIILKQSVVRACRATLNKPHTRESQKILQNCDSSLKKNIL